MRAIHSVEEISEELEEFNNNPVIPAFSGRNYPIEYLDSREFELLAYYTFKKDISNGVYDKEFDAVELMKGYSDRGRDLLLQFDGKNVGVVQCKRHTEVINRPTLARELIKFALHSVQDQTFLGTTESFKYYFISLNGYNDKAIGLINSFNKQVRDEKNLQNWTNEVIEVNKSIKFKSYEDVKTDLVSTLDRVVIEVLTGDDLDMKLKNSEEITKMFFRVEKVASEEMLRKVFEEFVGFSNDSDLERLRNRLQDIPKDKRMNFSVFTMYGYDPVFYNRVIRNTKILRKFADVKIELDKRFIDYLGDTIEKLQTLFVAGNKEISPFTKQVVVPYLLNKYSTQYSRSVTGSIMSDAIEKVSDSDRFKYKTIEQIKGRLIDVGRQVLSNDFSNFVGEGELLETKKRISHWIHNGFSSVDEMSERFDRDMVLLKPIIEIMEKKIEGIMPQNPTIVMDNRGLGDSEKEFAELMENARKLAKYDEK